jgi:D-glycero-D-manno-heptose 1,7-bisphosphate phosphatase
MNSDSPQRAVFLDRDGVLNRPLVKSGKPYPPASIEEFKILPEVPEAVSILRDLGFWLIVATNQPDVARGTQSRAAVEEMHDLLRARLGIEHFYVCWHDDGDACSCRKPRPGLLISAAEDHGLSLRGSYMIGDRWRDIDCGETAGCSTVFIDRGYTETLRMQPRFCATDLRSAADLIYRLENC